MTFRAALLPRAQWGAAVPDNLSDPEQIQEPFTTFLSDLKETRDSIAHHASSKAQIFFLPDDWLAKATKAANVTTECYKTFWQACYPQRGLPEYLDRLDVQTHRKIAALRLDAELSHG